MDMLLEGVARFANQVNEVAGKAAAWLTTFLVILVCYDVTIRKFFDISHPWTIELEWHLFSLIFLLGAGYAFKHNRHVRVDLFYSKFSKKDKAWTDLIGSIAFLVPWCIVIIIFSAGYAHESFLDNEGSPNPDGLGARYLIKSAVTLGFSLLLLQGLGQIAEAILTIKNAGQEN